VEKKDGKNSGREFWFDTPDRLTQENTSDPLLTPVFGPIDMGPEGGRKGSRVTFEGTPRCTTVGKAFADKPEF